MAKTGTATIVKLARKICKMRAIYGAADLASKTSSDFAAAVGVLITACQLLESLDDQPFEIDNTAPIRAGEDGPPAG